MGRRLPGASAHFEEDCVEFNAFALALEEREFWRSEDAGDIAIEIVKDGEDLSEIIHPPKQNLNLEIAGYTLVRLHANKVVVLASDGEVLCEKEINSEIHWQHFLKKFRENGEYRKQLAERSEGEQ